MKISAVLTGCVLFKNQEVAFFAVEPDGRPGESTFRVRLGTKWYFYQVEPKWSPVGMACAKYTAADDWVIVASSSEGQLWELTPGTKSEREAIIQDDYSGLTKLAGIDNAIWACGMGRVVLRREQGGSWTDLSAPSATIEEGVIGFTALTGVAPSQMVAVGWKGEIWIRNGNKWEEQDSGTNANLNAVSAGIDGQIVAVGDDGAVVVGRRNQWSRLDAGVDINLQSVCHFENEVFVSSDFELFRLENGVLVTETRFVDEDRPATCMNLFAGPETVFSQGEKDIFRFSKGLWARTF